MLESAKGNIFGRIILFDFLYGAEDGSELHPSMNLITYCNILRRWSSSQWTELLSKYIF
jgi:Zn-dependent M16 (insulinase) family peptidase